MRYSSMRSYLAFRKLLARRTPTRPAPTSTTSVGGYVKSGWEGDMLLGWKVALGLGVVGLLSTGWFAYQHQAAKVETTRLAGEVELANQQLRSLEAQKVALLKAMVDKERDRRDAIERQEASDRVAARARRAQDQAASALEEVQRRINNAKPEDDSLAAPVLVWAAEFMRGVYERVEAMRAGNDNEGPTDTHSDRPEPARDPARAKAPPA